MANPNIAKLKKKATDFEQKKQFDRALSLYIQLLEEAGRDLDDADLQLFNRVGDLLQRQGNVSEALAYYEKAVDVYAERGFLNNAIALCNKVLRQSPARTSVYYKLGKISATKGFKSDAKKNFLEYAERMQKSGHVDEAFRALKEFADLCPDQDDIRLMLADWLQKENRKSEAVEQLETLYIKLEGEGRAAEARATIDRIKAIDPAVVPRASGAFQAVKSNDLVFLDLDDADQPPPRRVVAAPPEPPPPPAPSAAPRVPALDGLILTFHPDDEDEAPTPPPAVIDGFESTASTEPAPVEALDSLVADFEPIATPAADDDRTLPSLLTMEQAAWNDPVEPVPHVEGLEGPRTNLVGAHPAMSPLLDAPPLSGEEFGDLVLARNDEEPTAASSGRAAHDLALPSSLPILPSDGSIDLLRVMATPLGSPVIDAADDAGAADAIDLLSLPPVGEAMPHSASLVWPVTGSPVPIEVGATPEVDPTSEVDPTFQGGDRATEAASEEVPTTERATDPTLAPIAAVAAELGSEVASAGDMAGAFDADASQVAHVVETPQAMAQHEPPRPRDTAELVAVDGSARTTDELLVVPSEEIDEETRRSLRLEFALDGDETPDAWVEAAMRATDDRALERSLDRLLTPLHMPVIGDPEAPTGAGDRDADRADDAIVGRPPAAAWGDEAIEAQSLVGDDAASPDASAPAADAWPAAGDAATTPHGAAASAPGIDGDAAALVASLGADEPAGEAPGEPPQGEHGLTIDSGELESLEAAFARFSRQTTPTPSETDVADGAGRPDVDAVPDVAADAPPAFATSDEVPMATGARDGGGDDGDDAATDDRAFRASASDTGARDPDAATVPVEGWGDPTPASRGVDQTAEPIAAAVEPGESIEPVDATLELHASVGGAPADTADHGVDAGTSDDVQAQDAGERVDAVGAPSQDTATLELLPTPEALHASNPPDDDPSLPPDFDLLDELLPPFMRHQPEAHRAGVGEGEGAHASPLGSALGGDSDLGSALDVDALRALMLDRGMEGSGSLSHPAPFDDPSVASAFREQAVELPLLDVDDLLSNDRDPYDAPLELPGASTDDILGTPPTFGEGAEQSFVPDPLFPVDDEANAEPASASTVGDGAEEWPQDAAPEVLIDGEWHDEHMGDLVSGEITAIRAEHDQLPPRATPRWDDLAAALLWPPPDGEAGVDTSGVGHSAGTPAADGAVSGGTPPRGSFLERLQTPRSTLSFGGVEAQLRRRLELDPSNLGLQRQLGEALIDLGKRDEGLLELDLAMAGYEQAGDLESARGVADIVLRIVPTSVRHHQKRVEYAVRSNDRVRLVEAYVELADSLFRSGEPEKARVVYSRVLELSPGNGRARFALGLLDAEEPATRADRRATPAELPPLPPTPADMVSLFDRAIPRTPATTLASISAEIPVITDGIFLPRVEPVAADATPARGVEDVCVHEVIAAEQDAREVGGSRQAREGDRSPDEPGGVAGSQAEGADHSTDNRDDQPPARGATGEQPRVAVASGSQPTVGFPPASPSPLEGGLADAAAFGAWPTAGHDAGTDAAQVAAGSPQESVGPRSDSGGDGDAAGTVAAGSPNIAWRSEDPAVGGGRDGAVDAESDDQTEDDADDDIDASTVPFPAPSLDDQIEAAFAVPPLVDLPGPVIDAASVDVTDLHDISVTPPLGAAAFATPFSSPAPQSPSITPMGVSPISGTPSGVRAVPQTPAVVRAVEPPPAATQLVGSDDDFVDLGSWLRDDEPVRSTRMVTAEAAPTGDEQADFDEMLRRFKQGVAANVDEEDYASHYDLGVAYKEMGLVDEAIAEFQKSLRGDSHRVRSYEALGQCFVEKGQNQVAVTLLRRALETTGADDQQLVGVLYLLGYASEVMARHADALSYYQRVFAVDIEFRDVAQRVAALELQTQ